MKKTNVLGMGAPSEDSQRPAADTQTPRGRALTEADHVDGSTSPPSETRVEIRMVAAVDENGLMGLDNRLPWQFKAGGQWNDIDSMLEGKTVVVGRRTAVAFGGRPTGGARVIVLTRSRSRPAGVQQGVAIARSVPEVLAVCTDAVLYVVGGAETFAAFMPYASMIRRYVASGSMSVAGPAHVHFPPLPQQSVTSTKDSPVVRGMFGVSFRVSVAYLEPTMSAAALPSSPSLPHDTTIPHGRTVETDDKRLFGACVGTPDGGDDDDADLKQALIQSFYDAKLSTAREQTRGGNDNDMILADSAWSDSDDADEGDDGTDEEKAAHDGGTGS